MKAEEFLSEGKIVWRKVGNKVVRGVRCTGGPRKGRVVSTASGCGAPVNPKKRFQMKINRARFGKKMARKARRSKRLNPVSKRVARLNRARRR
jgi:hypothetical protein